MSKKLNLLMFFVLISVSVMAQDTLQLLDSTLYIGSVVKLKRCEVVFKHDGIQTNVSDSVVFSIVFGAANNEIYNNYIEKLGPSHQGCFFSYKNNNVNYYIENSVSGQVLYGSNARLSGITNGTVSEIKVSNQISEEELAYYQMLREQRRKTWRNIAILLFGLNLFF